MLEGEVCYLSNLDNVSANSDMRSSLMSFRGGMRDSLEVIIPPTYIHELKQQQALLAQIDEQFLRLNLPYASGQAVLERVRQYQKGGIQRQEVNLYQENQLNIQNEISMLESVLAEKRQLYFHRLVSVYLPRMRSAVLMYNI